MHAYCTHIPLTDSTPTEVSRDLYLLQQTTEAQVFQVAEAGDGIRDGKQTRGRGCLRVVTLRQVQPRQPSKGQKRRGEHPELPAESAKFPQDLSPPCLQPSPLLFSEVKVHTSQDKHSTD